jgi:hypothetical protein
MPMASHSAVTEREIQLPPPYSLVALREGGNAFAHACAVADNEGAGVLVWVRRYDLIEFAVTLEPDEPLGQARRAFFAGSNALADALVSQAPPERAVTFDWPDAIRIDGVLVGGSRLGWPEGIAEDDVPPWLVFSGMVRAVTLRAGESGLRPLFGALDEVGFEDVDAGEIVASFARHLMHDFHEWSETGFASVARRWLGRLSGIDNGSVQLAENGDLLLARAEGAEAGERRGLRAALGRPTWLDPATQEPWL